MTHSSKPKQMKPRIVRYADLVPCFDAFIDTRTPGSNMKENFTIIGPGVSENPNQHVHIEEPHGFNIGGARQPPRCVNSQHSHETDEVFFVHSGTWSFNLGEFGEDAKITLRPGDLISIPTHIFRGFENIGDDIGYLWAVLGKDDPGHVLWAPDVFEMAKKYGLVLLENGTLIDTTEGETVPEGARVMPVTSRQEIEKLQVMSNDGLRKCCVMSSDVIPSHDRDGVSTRDLIGAGAPIDWPHGFKIRHFKIEPGFANRDQTVSVPDVIFIQTGALTIKVADELWHMGAGDTATIPVGETRQFINKSDKPVEFLRVQGEA